MEQKIKEFKELLATVITLIQEDSFDKAKKVFNKDIFPRFSKQIWEKSDSTHPFVELFCEIDDYLNNEGAKILNATSKEKVLSLYGEYREMFNKLTND